ncbi:MAG TPA: hypothetical protein VJ813_05705 [Vicinamibacterales bacterium]|nr:hypothetical protein [Vicinamibacterales bacterium]
MRPSTDRPVSGVWLRVSSLPVPPLRDGAAVLRAATLVREREAAVRRAAAGLAALRDGLTPLREAAPVRFFEDNRLPGAFRAEAAVRLRAADFAAFPGLAFDRGFLAPAVLRPARFLGAIARTPAPAFRFDEVLRRPLLFALFFLAINPLFPRRRLPDLV